MHPKEQKNENRGAISGEKVQALVLDLLSSFPEKNQEIVKRRFGITLKDQETLEAIGHDYGITRERVRQIEAATLKVIKESAEIKKINDIESILITTLNSLGGIAEEDVMLNKILGSDSNMQSYRNAVLFIFHISDKFFDFSENNHFNPSWTLKKGFFKRTTEIIETAKDILKEINTPITFEALYQKIDVAPIKTNDLNQEAINNYLAISKEVIPNPYQDWGLSSWGEINPRGVKDRAFLVLKKNGKPLHFQQITELINQSNLSKKAAHAPTVHNELIKDGRFVLVGRGIYGLKEWGYREGTVKDIIVDILKKIKKAVPKEHLVDLVLKERIVRRSTVLLNLQDSSLFIRNQKDEIILK